MDKNKNLCPIYEKTRVNVWECASGPGKKSLCPMTTLLRFTPLCLLSYKVGGTYTIVSWRIYLFWILSETPTVGLQPPVVEEASKKVGKWSKVALGHFFQTFHFPLSPPPFLRGPSTELFRKKTRNASRKHFKNWTWRMCLAATALNICLL